MVNPFELKVNLLVSVIFRFRITRETCVKDKLAGHVKIVKFLELKVNLLMSAIFFCDKLHSTNNVTKFYRQILNEKLTIPKRLTDSTKESLH